MTPESTNRVNLDSEEEPEPQDDQAEADYLQLIREGDDHTPEEAGYGHGV